MASGERCVSYILKFEIYPPRRTGSAMADRLSCQYVGLFFVICFLLILFGSLTLVFGFEMYGFLSLGSRYFVFFWVSSRTCGISFGPKLLTFNYRCQQLFNIPVLFFFLQLFEGHLCKGTCYQFSAYSGPLIQYRIPIFCASPQDRL